MRKKATITIGENDIKSKDIDVVNDLLKQLSPQARKIDFRWIREVMKSGTVVSLREKGFLIGMGTLLPLKKMFSFCGSIEDVVVNEKYRGQGLGKKITITLIKKSKKLGMQCVALTSSPKRKAANRLYTEVGFERRKTNVYELKN